MRRQKVQKHYALRPRTPEPEVQSRPVAAGKVGMGGSLTAAWLWCVGKWPLRKALRLGARVVRGEAERRRVGDHRPANLWAVGYIQTHRFTSCDTRTRRTEGRYVGSLAHPRFTGSPALHLSKAR